MSRLLLSSISLASVVGRAQRGDRTDQHAHRVRVVVKPVDEALAHVLVDERVAGHVVLPLLQLHGVGQFAVEQQVRDLQVGAVLGELFDGVPAISQDPGLAIEVRDGALTRRCLHEGRVVDEQRRIELADSAGGKDVVGDRDGDLLAGAIVDDGDGVGHVVPLRDTDDGSGACSPVFDTSSGRPERFHQVNGPGVPLRRSTVTEMDAARDLDDAQLMSSLDWNRSVVMRKLDGLSYEEATRVRVPTGLTLVGVVTSRLGRTLVRYSSGLPTTQSTSTILRDDSVSSVDEVITDYLAAVDRSREIVRTAPSLEARSVLPHDYFGIVTLRWILLHMTTETTRHAGHLDILRELTDGQTGY